MNIIKEYVKNTDANILDIGCGTGGFLVAASNNYGNIYGIDIHKRSILRAIARSKIYDKEINIVQGNVIKMSFKNDFFDFIFNVGMIEHIIAKNQRKKIMDELFKRGVDVSIATGFQAPLVAAELRLRWAGIPAAEYDYKFIATWDNMHASKPHNDYYKEILSHVKRNAED